MKKTLLMMLLSFLILGNSPAVEAVEDYDLVALQHQLNKAREELGRLMLVQSRDTKKELERLKREIERIYKEIQEELKRAQIVIQEEDRNLKKYLVRYKIEVEKIKIDIDEKMKIEKIKANFESEKSKLDIAQSKGLWQKITSENASTPKSTPSPSPSTEIVPPTIALKEETAPERAQPVELAAQAPAAKGGEVSAEKAVADSEAIDVKMRQFGADIVKIKAELAGRTGNTSHLWVALAKLNMEMERFLKTLDSGERYKYLTSDQYVVGSYEVAILSIKRALAPNPNDPDLNYLLGEVYDEINDGRSASEYAEVARRLYKNKGDREKAAKAGNYARTLQKKYNITKEVACGATNFDC